MTKLTMPAEWEPHERTLIAWPARADMWGDLLEDAKREHVTTVAAIAAFEPVTLVADPSDAAEARSRVPAENVELLALPIDDSWLRDNGPIVVTGEDGARAAVDFAFNGWGEKMQPFDRDDRLTALLADRLGLSYERSPFVLEGGSIAVDGRGTLLTTEQCLLHPSRNPARDRDGIARELCARLGGERVVWLGQGLVEDVETDGHVDLVAAFLPNGEVLLQDAPHDDPNHAGCQANAARLRAAGLTARPMPWLARAELAGRAFALSYMNHYLCNGAVIAPLAGQPELDEQALALLAQLHPEREVVGVPALTLAWAGGGPHCITQQVPAARG
ncbi:MAG TPA: agmatine deiminase family protein [Conexibacter sp.]|nr:agmatine deiminase family protein [Conexibacter sp.]